MDQTELVGAWRRLVGELSPAQSAFVLGGAATVGVAVAARTVRGGGGWFRSALMAGTAADLVGGLIAFQFGPTREQYARSPVRERLGFVASHVQPFVLPVTRQGTWTRALLRYTTVVLASGALESIPLSSKSRRAIAGILGGAASIVDLATSPPGQRWLGPVYFIKLIAGHAGIPRVHRP